VAVDAPALGTADAIVVAAGASRRMEGIDKLDRIVAGRSLLEWSVAAIAAAPEVESIALVTTAERIDRIVAAGWLPESVRAVVPGGERRHESVAAGLAALDRLGGGSASDERVVLVHDGARPLVTGELIARVASAAAEHGAAVPVVAVAETLKRVEGDVVRETVDRAGLAAAQTPQGSGGRSCERPSNAIRRPGWRLTDEAALLEACTIPVHAIPGDPANLKVTLPADLDRVDAALRPTAGTTVRVGIGQDLHPFGAGESADPRRRHDRGRTPARRPFGRRRRPPRDRRRDPRGGRPGRPRTALPGRPRDPARRREHRAPRGRSSGRPRTPASSSRASTSRSSPHGPASARRSSR
jgi:2-C-methyl-D-erythritol 4-phosphate cytidylyltransferase